MRNYPILLRISEGKGIRTLIEIHPKGFDRVFTSGQPFEIPKDFRILIDREGKFPDLITSSMILASKRFTEFLMEHAGNDISSHPFPSFSSEGRLDVEYFIIKPLRTIECLDRDRSDIAYHPDGQIRAVFDYVIDLRKIPVDAKIVRLGEMPYYVLFSMDLIKKMKGKAFLGPAFRKTKSSNGDS